MSRTFTSEKTRCLQIAACILLMFNTACTPQMDDSGSSIKFSDDPAENSYLKQIFTSCNGDSVCKCAELDYVRQRYYIFWTGEPSQAKFNNYLVKYAKERYGVNLIECGSKNRPGAYYYNKQMAEFFLKAKKKPLYTIYVEAKDRYNKAILSL